MKIFKWKINVTGRQTLVMPLGAKILTVQMQNDTPCIWAMCDESATITNRTFLIYGTGNELPHNPGQYIGTFQVGMFVWHLFEIT